MMQSPILLMIFDIYSTNERVVDAARALDMACGQTTTRELLVNRSRGLPRIVSLALVAELDKCLASPRVA